MKKKNLFLLVSLILFLLMLAGNVVAIDIDSCGYVISAPGTYDLIGDISQSGSGNCISITTGADGATLDCHDFTIDGIDESEGGRGIRTDNADSLTIQNCRIFNFMTGMYLESMDDSLIKNITLIANYNGIIFESTVFAPISNNTFEGITATNNLNDVMISAVIPSAALTNNTFRDMTLNNNGGSGIYFNRASNNIFTNITASGNNDYGIVLINSSNNNILTGNEFCSNDFEDVECESVQTEFSNNKCGSGNVCGGICIPCGTDIFCEHHNVWGWAWSENIGWISFSCENNVLLGTGVDYGVDINISTGEFSGYAWSENIGWISFEPADVNLAYCPYPPPCAAKLNLSTGEVSGWARALAYGDGWDGWIGLRGSWVDKVFVISNPSPPPASVFKGWAWGDDVVGWISFNCSNTGCPAGNYKAMTDVVINQPPYIESLVFPYPPEYCNFSPIGQIGFEWTYQDDDGDQQAQYNLQVATDAGFNSLVVDVVENPPAIPPGSKGTSGVSVKQTPDGPLDIPYGDTYFWRVKVKDTAGSWSTSWESGPSFSTPSHPYPNPSFTPDLLNPPAEVEVSFDNTTEFYDTAISYYWTFQDGNPDYSWEFEPMVIFASSGPKTVTLTATDSDGYSCTETDTLTATLPLPEWKEIYPF